MLCMQAAEQAQKLREARKEKADLEGNVNDMERAQDFLKAGNVKVPTSHLSQLIVRALLLLLLLLPVAVVQAAAQNDELSLH